jgi:hypothetical protein
MKKLAPLVIAIALLTTSFAASAQNLTEEQARTVIAPWYRLFNQPVNGDMRTLQEQILTADYESCWAICPVNAGAVTHRLRSSEVLPNRSRI